MEAKAFEHAKVIVVPSRGLASELMQTYPELDGKRIVQIPNPVDIKNFARPEAFDSKPIREGLGFDFDDIVMVFVALGNFERKGLRLLLEALAALQCPTAKLLVVGGGQSEIREYAQVRDKLGLSGSVVFVEFQADVRPYLWSSDLFVFPSAYEIFPLAPLQAAAAGLPIVTTRLHGVEEFLQNGVNGWLVDREVGALMHTLSQVLVDKDKLAYMGATAGNLVDKYDVPSFLSQWQSLLDSLA
jgi:glycosyltransferase involved in cell wall biosynthesis